MNQMNNMNDKYKELISKYNLIISLTDDILADESHDFYPFAVGQLTALNMVIKDLEALMDNNNETNLPKM